MSNGPLDDFHDKRDKRDKPDERGGRDGRDGRDGRNSLDGLSGRQGRDGREDGRKDQDTHHRRDRGLSGDAPGGEVLGGDVLGGDVLGGDVLGGDALAEVLDGDELALRRLLHNAVDDLAPSEGALDHLRRAVPARRARKRQALVGMAASVILLGTAIPAFVHVANSGGISDDRSVNAGHGEQAQGGTGTKAGDDARQKGGDNPSGQEPGTPGKSEESEKPEKPGSEAPDDLPGAPVDPAESIPATTPTCEASQLGVDATEVGAPDPEGKVYGAFRIANVSGTACAVTGSGSVGFQAQGAADPAKISVVEHTTGDAATGLPDPSVQAGAVLLEPSTSYEVKFAFVPSETCPTTGPTPDPSPTDGGSSGTTDGTGTTTTETQLVTEDGTADGSIVVSHTPEAGAPAASATVPNACAGTIYRTSVLNPSS
ncbi:hypothetical protein [Streptomyces sp. NPDC059909]|uniref:hypothetical protein n=1 Tax=Streptomyces sp. NPDC059909 TaxID=3346998 RepID=UPI003662CF16